MKGKTWSSDLLVKSMSDLELTPKTLKHKT